MTPEQLHIEIEELKTRLVMLEQAQGIAKSDSSKEEGLTTDSTSFSCDTEDGTELHIFKYDGPENDILVIVEDDHHEIHVVLSEEDTKRLRDVLNATYPQE